LDFNDVVTQHAKSCAALGADVYIVGVLITSSGYDEDTAAKSVGVRASCLTKSRQHSQSRRLDVIEERLGIVGNWGRAGMIEIRRLKEKHEADLCAQMMANSEPWMTLSRDYDVLLKSVTGSSREVYLAILRDEVLGFVMINMHGAFVGYIQSICVASDWRNKGVGSQLMAFAENRIFSETPNAFLCVSSFNKSAQRLYKKLGYKVIGKLKDFIVSGHSEILMRKTISSLAEFKSK